MKYLNFNGNSKPAVLFFIILFIVEIINISPLNAQYDLYGIWARKTGVTSANSGIIVNQMITDSKGNMYICGRFYGTVSLSDNTCSLNNSGGYPYTNSKYNGYYDSANRWNDGTAEKSDGFVSKYDNNGNWIWSVTVSTNVYDEITGISLSEDEESLVFLGAYGNAAYSGIVVDSYIITYGTGNQETLTFNTPLTTLSNFTLVKVKTNDGSKEFQNYLGYGKTGEYMRLGSIYQNDDGYIYLSGLILSGTTYYWKIWKYDFDGNSQGSIDKALATGAHGATLALSKNKSVSNLYLVAAHEASGPLWHTYLAKTDLTSGTSGYLSYISAYSDANSTTYLQNYGRYGIVSKGTDVNSADSHLFLVGYTLMDFVYQSINTTITNAGGEDGIIICYDPQNSDGATNMRWMVNLRAAGSQRIWDCKFDELTQTLQVVGSVDENEVDFNPKGVSNMQKSKSGTAMFYAVYDINGICLHVEIIESETGNEAGQTLDIAGDNISIFGTFSGSPFQVDPSERLEPLRTTQSSVFLAKYSTNPLSVPEPRLPGSYSAADKLKGTYGIAYHDVMPCLTLGALNNPIDYNTAFGYVPVNYANGTANPNYNGFDGAISYTSDYKGLQIKVKAVNAKTSGAYMAAWIDFNGNGIFDPGEVSEILPVPANTNTLSEFNLSWPALPTVSRANIDTYMRIRLTSEELSGSWGAGNAADGEVEDYAVSLNLLELSKTAVSSYITAPGMARLNDTITYTISLKNNIQSDILLFDPIPEGSEYYDSDPAGSLVNDFNFYGQTVPAVVWNLADLAPGERTFKFRALAKSKPTNSDSILNIAFAVMKGDTLASTGGNCSLAEIEYLSIIANNDYTNAFIGSSTSINVLDNDYYLPSCAATLSPTVTVNGTRGSATLGSDGTLSYTPTSTDFVGYDSITYQISCNGDATAKVYFTIIPKPDNVSDADCFIEAPELNWTIAELTPMSTELVNVYGPLTVGDLDNDGNIEVIILGTIGYSDYQCKTMKVFYYDKITNGLKLKKSFDFPGAMENDYRGSSVIFRHNGQGYLVVANRNDGYLYAFDVDGVPLWKSTAQFTTVTPAIANVGVADFNNDGVPEIYAGNAIFAYDGTFICRGSGNKGLYRYYPADRELLSTFAVDFDGDGKLELVAGMQIYDVNIAAAAMTVRTDWQLPAAEFNKIVNYTTVPSDGQSIAADIDNDGILEIVMSAKTTANKHVIVVWKPQPNNRSVLLGSFESTAAQHNTPMIGNLDDNPYMEIVTLNSGLNMYALRYDDTKTMGQRIVQKWNLTHTDGSGATGATLFDFDQDGTTEIVYRDEQRLRIIDGSGSAAVPKAEFDDVRSGTVREYPVIVDIDGDGQAEILVTGWTGSGPTGANAAFGPIRIFKSGIASSPWAPARSVWNQYMYNSVNVNEDLTIPAYQLNPATVFPGNDGQLGTSDDIRPYNNFLTQQTALNKNGTPLWLVPNAQLDTPDPTFNYYAIGDSLYIELKIKNIGNAALQAPVKITVHKDVVPAPAAARYTYQYPQSILQGASAEVKFSIPNYSSWIGAVDNDTKLILKINDNGNGYNDQPVCDSVNIKYEQALNALVFAKNDSIEYIQGIRPFDLIDVLTNDVIPAACTGLNPVVVNVAKGSASVDASGKIVYDTPDTDFVGYDTITYSITCNANISYAKVYIIVHERPDNLVDQENCYIAAPKFDFTIKRQWNHVGGHSNTGPLVGDLDGNGFPEIVAFSNDMTKMVVHDGQNGNVKAEITVGSTVTTGGWYPVNTAILVDADRNGMGEVIIAKPNLEIVRYEADTVGGTFKMVLKRTSTRNYVNPYPTTSASKDNAPHLNVADLNGDGVPELIVYNQIYNAETLEFLGETEAIATAHKGCDPGAKYNRGTNSQTVADIDGDGLPEIVAGGKVYKVTIDVAAKKAYSKILYDNTNVPDGFTAVADIDMDGNLDIVVASTSGNTVSIYVWNPLTSLYIKKEVYTSTSSYPAHSLPFIGDIDGNTNGVTDKYPEICLVTNQPAYSNGGRVWAFKFDPGAKELNQKWILNNSDTSGGTGITLFDFDNNGVAELVYRDETRLQIYNGSGTAPVPMPGGVIACSSGTAWEYPVIADTDGDGSANICVTCGTDIYVYEGLNHAWAPTRQVWNQVNYEPLYINEDLTVSRYPLPKNAKFGEKYPYNGALIQVPTMVNGNFDIVMLAADPAVNSTWAEDLNATTARIWVRIDNLGIKNTNAGLPVALYGVNPPPTPADGSHIAIKAVGVNIVPGDSYDMYFDVPKGNMPSVFSVRIQDDGVKYPADGSYLDCDYTNNTKGMDVVWAYNDHAQTIVNVPVLIDVLANDIYPSLCTPLPTDISLSTASGSAAVLDGDKIKYIPATNYSDADTIYYTIRCGANESTARVVVIVYNPDNIVDDMCVVTPTPGVWSIREAYRSSEGIFEMSIPLIGDIDNDGIVEIVVSGKSINETNRFAADSIKVFDGLNKTLKYKFQVEKFHASFGTIAMADVDRDGYAEIFVATNEDASVGNQGYIFCYEYDPVIKNYKFKWKSAQVYTTNVAERAFPYMNLTDFNGDGIPELVANDRIFNAQDGRLLLDCELISNGLDYGTGAGHISYYGTQGTSKGAFSSIADMDGDGFPELVAGRNIYKISINSLSDETQNTCVKSPQSLSDTRIDLGDGYTAVADLDLDGYLDVVVVRGSSVKYMYAWSGKTGELLHTNIVSITDGTGYGGSIPFVGDLDGDGVPEVSFSVYNKLVAYKYNKDAKSFTSMPWSPLGTTDISASTTLTLFDFDQDEKMELVYRDQSTLRIIDGATGLVKDGATMPCYSWTMNEYPVVADITGSGHASIIVLGKPAAISHGNGYLYVFESDLSKPGAKPWAPARKVWNQWPYNAVNINEDLTVPKFQMNPATVFPGENGKFGDSDDVRPYNAHLQQQTTLNSDGSQLWIAPDAAVLTSPAPVFSYYALGDSAVITVQLKNEGDVALESPVYLSAYKNTIADGNALAVDSIMAVVYPGETVTATVTIRHIRSFMPMNQIVIRVNDNKGKGDFGQPECIEDNNDYTFGNLLLLANDYVSTEMDMPVELDVLANDLLSNCDRGGLSLVSVSDKLAEQAKHGDAEFRLSDTLLLYTPTMGWYGMDSLRYVVSDCNTANDSAWVYLLISKPLAKKYVACPGAELAMGFANIIGVAYNWYDASTGGTLAHTGDTYSVVQGSVADIGTWWVEPVWHGVSFPRYRVDLWLSDNCGTSAPTGCAEDGTVIWSEDFGGNTLYDPQRMPGNASSHPLQGKTTYKYVTRENWLLPGEGEYGIMKSIQGYTGQYWAHNYLDDHSSWGDQDRGYFLTFDATLDPGQFYEFDIDDLCNTISLTFSAWLMNINSASYVSTYNPVPPKVSFIIEDNIGNVLATFNTGVIPPTAEPTWLNYSFEFDVPPGVAQLKVKFMNDQFSSNNRGNDIAIDDIEIRLCAPPVRITNPVEDEARVCPESSFTFRGEYTDNPVTFTKDGEELTYFWIYSATGDVKTPSSWVKIDGTEGIEGSDHVESEYTIPFVTEAHEGYYRLVVADAANINNYNCRSMSRVIHFKVHEVTKFHPDIRIQACSDIGVINLSKYLDTAGFEWVKWYESTPLSPAVDEATGNINSNGLVYPNTYGYRYQLKNTCFTPEGRLYIKTISGSPVGLPPATVVVCWEDAVSLSLDRIMGIEAGGVFEPVESSVGDVSRYVEVATAPHIYAGAAVFNGREAYLNLSAGDYGITYQGDTDARKVVFKYKITDTNSCLYGNEYTIEIILTNSLAP